MEHQQRQCGSGFLLPGTTPLEAQVPPLPRRRLNNQLLLSRHENPTSSTDYFSLESAFSNLSITPQQLGHQAGAFAGSGSVQDPTFFNSRMIDKKGLRDLSFQYLLDKQRSLLSYATSGYNGDSLGYFGIGYPDEPVIPTLTGSTHIGSATTRGSSIGEYASSSPQRVPLWVEPKGNWVSVGDFGGRISGLAKDQYGCRLLQRALGGLTREQVDVVFQEVIDYVEELVVDPFGNYVVQKLVEVCREKQRTGILLNITKKEFQLVSICLNMHGTRAVQKLLTHITTPEQVSIVMSALSPGAVALIKDANGHHVIQHCLKHFPAEDNKYLLTVVADNCFNIAKDKCGCCVLQLCVQYSRGELRDCLVAEIIANALLLAEDRYGNYVVQHIVGLKVSQITARLLAQLQGSFAALSCNKYGSNVVEKCLLESSEDQSTWIIEELLNSPNASLLLLDPFGNYVIQCALSVSKGGTHLLLVELVRTNFSMLGSNIYGKKVLAWFEKRRNPYV